jgi:hypothetical protein
MCMYDSVFSSTEWVSEWVFVVQRQNERFISYISLREHIKHWHDICFVLGVKKPSSYSSMLCLAEKLHNLTVFYLARPGVEPTIYPTYVYHALFKLYHFSRNETMLNFSYINQITWLSIHSIFL